MPPAGCVDHMPRLGGTLFRLSCADTVHQRLHCFPGCEDATLYAVLSGPMGVTYKAKIAIS